MKKGLIIAALFACSSFVVAETSRKFVFYGAEVVVPLEESIRSFEFNSKNVNGEKLDAQLKTLENKGLKKTFQELRKESRKLNLDDLGYLQLVKVLTLRLFPDASMNFRKTIAWYGLREAGYDAVLAGEKNYICLFVVLGNETDGGYEMNYMGKTYTSASGEKIPYREMQVFHPSLLQDSARNSIDFNPDKIPLLPEKIAVKSRNFLYQNKGFEFRGKYNENMVNYLNDLPSFKIGTHLINFEPGAEAERSIDDSMRVWLYGKTREEKLEFILAFTQKAFEYKADGDYRRKEKRNFIEQTLADDYTDCEDKAVLFCYLAEKYLQYETVLIYSEAATHVTAAVQLDETASGQNFIRNGKKYLICEGAGIGYHPGETMLSRREIQEAAFFD